MSKTARLLLWLLVIFGGIGVGAGLYEARIVVPIWRATPPESWVNTGTAFWAFVTSGPLTLVILASLYPAWRAAPPIRGWWLAALAVAIVERIATFGYFIPVMYWMQNQVGTVAVAATLDGWDMANHARHVSTILAWLLSLKALSLLGAGPHAAGGGRPAALPRSA